MGSLWSKRYSPALRRATLGEAEEIEAVTAADDAAVLEQGGDGLGAGAGGDIDEGLGGGAVGEIDDAGCDGCGDQQKQQKGCEKLQVGASGFWCLGIGDQDLASGFGWSCRASGRSRRRFILRLSRAGA